MKRWTLILLIANILTAAWLIQMQREDDSRATESRLLQAESSEVQSIRIQSVNTSTIVLEKKSQEWRLVEPIQWQANRFAVQRMLNQLLFLEQELSFPVSSLKEAGKTLEEYGLDNPQTTITLETPMREQSIAIGSLTGVGNKLYVLTGAGESIAVVNQEAFEGFQANINELRSEQIFDMPIYAIESIVIKVRDPELTLRLSRNNESWAFESPIATSADNERVNALLNELTRLKVSEFIGDQGESTNATAGLDTPAMRVSLRGKNRHQTLLLGNTLNTENGLSRRYASMELSPTTFTLLGNPFDKIRTHWEQLREHRILRSSTRDVSSVEITREGQRILLQKLETGPWQIVSEAGGALQTIPADSDAVLGLLAHLDSLQATSFVSDAPSEGDLERYGLEEAEGEIVLRGKETVRILIGKPINDAARPMRYVSTSEAQSVYGVDDAALELIEAALYAYRSRVILSLPNSATIEQFILTPAHAQDTPTTSLSKDAASQTQWNALLGTFSPLVAKAFIPGIITQEGFLPRGAQEMVLWKHQLEVRVTLPGAENNQQESYTYWLSDITAPAGVIAAPTDESFSFLLSDNDAAILRKLLETSPEEVPAP